MDDVKVSFSEKHEIPIARIEESGLKDADNLKRLFKMLLNSMRDSNRGIIVDCSRLNNNVSTQILNAFTSLAGKALADEKFFMVASLKGKLRDKYEELALDATLPAYDTLDSAVMAMGPPVQGVRKSKKKKAKSAKQKKAAQESSPSTSTSDGWELPSFSLPSWMQKSGDGASSGSSGQIVWALGGCFAAALVAVFMMNSSLRASVAGLFASKAPVLTNLSGEVQFMHSSGPRKDAGALVVVWPNGASPGSKLSPDDLDSLSESGDGVFATKVESDGTYSLALECGKSDLLNILVLSNNLKDAKGNQSVASSGLQSMDSVFDDPSGVVGEKAYELSFLTLSSSKPDLSYNVTISKKYVPN